MKKNSHKYHYLSLWTVGYFAIKETYDVIGLLRLFLTTKSAHTTSRHEKHKGFLDIICPL